MTAPIGSSPRPFPSSPASAASAGPGRADSPSRFAEVLRADSAPAEGAAAEPSPLMESIRHAGRRMAAAEQQVDRAMSAAERGRVFSQGELLALQAGVYRYTQELELASKLVDKSTAAVRQTLKSQR